MEYSEQEIHAMRNGVIESGIEDGELLAAAEANDVDGAIARLEVMLQHSCDQADARDAVMAESLDVSGDLYARVNLYRLLRQLEGSARERRGQASEEEMFLRRISTGGAMVPRLGGLRSTPS